MHTQNFFTNGRCEPKAFSPLAWSQEICQESVAPIPMRGNLGKRCGSGDGEMQYSGHLNRAVGQSPPKARLPLPLALCVLPESTHSQAASVGGTCIGGWETAEGARRQGCAHVLRSSWVGGRHSIWAGIRRAAWVRGWVGVDDPLQPMGLVQGCAFPGPGSQDCSRLQSFGKGREPVFFKGTGFIPALGGDSPYWQ